MVYLLTHARLVWIAVLVRSQAAHDGERVANW
jgi:hypothetical protein